MIHFLPSGLGDVLRRDLAEEGDETERHFPGNNELLLH